MSKHKICVPGPPDACTWPYISRVEAHLKAILGARFSPRPFTPQTPPATTTHAITEFRIGRNLIRMRWKPRRQGYAAMRSPIFRTPPRRGQVGRGHSGARPGRDHLVSMLHAGTQASAS